MKSFIDIIIVISFTGFLALQDNSAKRLDIPFINNSNISHQDLPVEITNKYLYRGAIRLDKLNNLFVDQGLTCDLIFGTLIPKVDIPGDRIQIQTKEVKIMVARISNTELKRRRVLYYAAKRRVDSLEDKRKASINIIKTGKKERIQVDKETNEKTVVTVKLSDAQILDEKRILAELDLDLEKANDELKLRDFGFSKATKNQTNNILTQKQAYREKKEEEKLNTVKALMNSAIRNGGLQNVLDLQKLSGEGGKINAVRAEMMKIVRKENKNGYPIRNVSHKTVEIIMAGLLSWDTATSKEPFAVS